MRQKRHVMKLLLAGGGLVLILLLWSGTIQAVSINWGTAGNPLYDESGVGASVLENGDIVQLICDRARDGIDLPGGNGLPMGDDELIHSSCIGQGSFFEGEFSDEIMTGSVGVGDVLYVRAWNDSTLESASRWGDTRQHCPDTWVVDNNMFFTLNATENGSWATVSPRLRSLEKVFKPMLMGDGGGAKRTVRREGGLVRFSPPLPNPFREEVALGYRVTGESSGLSLRLDIYDTGGRLVRSLQSPVVVEGDNQFVWDGKDSTGKSAGSGIFLCRLSVEDGGSVSVFHAKLVRAE